MNRKVLTITLLMLATVALAGGAWMSARSQGPPVGEGKTVRVMLTPT